MGKRESLDAGKGGEAFGTRAEKHPLHGVPVISSAARNLSVARRALCREISPYGRNDGGFGS